MKHFAEEKLRAYGDLVRWWARRVDLVSEKDVARFEERHIRDSLRAAPLVASLGPGPAVDVGSGAGLPGIPLSIVDPDRPWTLLEPRSKRAGFLEEVSRELELRCDVVVMTAEQAAADRRFAGAHVVATARALAAPTRSFDLLAPLVAPGGVSVVFAGGRARIPANAELWGPGLPIMRRHDERGSRRPG